MKIIKGVTLLQSATNHPYIFRTKYWIEINKDLRETYTSKANSSSNTK